MVRGKHFVLPEDDFVAIVEIQKISPAPQNRQAPMRRAPVKQFVKYGVVQAWRAVPRTEVYIVDSIYIYSVTRVGGRRGH
jgi:hypothetical protein